MGNLVIIIIIGILILLFIFVISTYNSLVVLKNKVKDSWANRCVIKRRADLIPNLVETVKGYAAHEKETLEAVIQARNSFTNASTKEDEIKANGEITNALTRLFALSEAYPDLKANENFISLQNDLKDSEDKISVSRQYYNDTVLQYKNKLEMFPSNIIAGIFNFKPESFFEIAENEREVPKVQF